LPVLHPHSAGIDVGATQHFVCVPADAVGADESPVRSFGAFTGQLNQVVEWLRACQVQTVAMESTGVYWIPLFQKLEAAGLEVVLVNARHLKQVPGRKTDLKDCQWIQRLHSYGLLNGSFRPGDAICRLRTLVRHRANLIDACSQQVLHRQRSLDQMNVHLHHVISDLDGQTGLRTVDAILSGQRDPKELVKLRDPRVRKSTVAEMEAALEGDWRAEHLWVLQQARDAYGFFQGQIRRVGSAARSALAADRHRASRSPGEPTTAPSSSRARCPASPAKEEEGGQRSGDRFHCGTDSHLRGGFDPGGGLQSPERADPDFGDRGGDESLAQCQSLLFLVGLVSREQDQRRQSAQQSHGASEQSCGDFAAHLGDGGGPIRHLAGLVPSPHEVAARTGGRPHRHGSDSGWWGGS
jgi:hypothetical protein